MSSLVAPLINVLILVTLLAYYLRKPLKDFVYGRHTSLKEELLRVGEQLKQAQIRFDEFSSKLKAIDAEARALRNQTKQDAEAMKVRVLTDAKRASSLIVTDAQASSKALYADLKLELRQELALRVVERAEGILRERLTGADRARIRNEFSSQVESIR